MSWEPISGREAIRAEMGFHVPRPDFAAQEWVCAVCKRCIGAFGGDHVDERNCPGDTGLQGGGDA